MKVFMNSVHEPGPNGDSKTLPSRKTRSKTRPSARAPKLAQLTQPACAQTRPGRARVVVSWPAQRSIVAGLPGRIADTVSLAYAGCAARHACAPTRIVARTATYRRMQTAVSWPSAALPAWSYRGRVRAGTAVSWPASRHNAQPPSHPGHNTLCVLRYKRPAFKPASVTIHPSVLRYKPCLIQPFKQPQSRYKICIVTQPSAQPSLLSCNTMPNVTIYFQPNCTPKGHVTIQYSIVS